ncbi:hypothetical protein BLOT_012912 [Blomia tropicalis]|nr:hypothetical protein BLOT_012912 [Blomia tropicalis]
MLIILNPSSTTTEFIHLNQNQESKYSITNNSEYENNKPWIHLHKENIIVTVIEWRLDELQMDGRRSTLEAFQEFQARFCRDSALAEFSNFFIFLTVTVIEWRLDEVQIDGRRSTLEAFQEFQGLNLFEILRKQSLALFIFPTAAAIGSSKQSSSINRRWAISYYFLLFPTIHTQYITIQYPLHTILSNTHYNTLLPKTH